MKNIPNIIFIATFSGVSPIGAAIGILISETVTDSGSLQTLAITILQGLATGSLIYVVFFEVIEKERQKKAKRATSKKTTKEQERGTKAKRARDSQE